MISLGLRMNMADEIQSPIIWPCFREDIKYVVIEKIKE